MSCLKNLKVKYGNLEHYITKLITEFFGFWDKTDSVRTLVLTTHGIIKKTNKTPEKEIEKAENIRLKYFELKNKSTNGNKK